MIDTTSAIAVTVALIAIIPGVLAYRQAKTMAEKQEQQLAQKVDGEAYARAIGVWTAALKAAEDEIVRLTEIVKAQRADSEFAEARIRILEREVVVLRRQLNLPLNGES